jgi:hypothetical protein
MQLPPQPSPKVAPSYDEIVTPASFGLGAEVLRRAGPALARGLAFVLAIATEFRRAAAATHRYERLQRMAHAGDDPAVSTARRIYIEFYSDR